MITDMTSLGASVSMDSRLRGNDDLTEKQQPLTPPASGRGSA
jgi:hypothetical protein